MSGSQQSLECVLKFLAGEVYPVSAYPQVQRSGCHSTPPPAPRLPGALGTLNEWLRMA